MNYIFEWYHPPRWKKCYIFPKFVDSMRKKIRFFTTEDIQNNPELKKEAKDHLSNNAELLLQKLQEFRDFDQSQIDSLLCRVIDEYNKKNPTQKIYANLHNAFLYINNPPIPFPALYTIFSHYFPSTDITYLNDIKNKPLQILFFVLNSPNLENIINSTKMVQYDSHPNKTAWPPYTLYMCDVKNDFSRRHMCERRQFFFSKLHKCLGSKEDCNSSSTDELVPQEQWHGSEDEMATESQEQEHSSDDEMGTSFQEQPIKTSEGSDSDSDTGSPKNDSDTGSSSNDSECISFD